MRFGRMESYVCLGKRKLEIVVESSLRQGLTFSVLVFWPLGPITITQSTRRVIPSYSFFWRITNPTNNRRLACDTFGQQCSAFSPVFCHICKSRCPFKTQAKYSRACFRVTCAFFFIFPLFTS